MKNWEKYAYELSRMVVDAPESYTDGLFIDGCPFQESGCDHTCPAWCDETKLCASSLEWWKREAE